VIINQIFGGTDRLLLQDRLMNEARNQHGICCLLHAGFFLGLFFDLEDGGDILSRNIG
jgi:hypothetical protein